MPGLAARRSDGNRVVPGPDLWGRLARACTETSWTDALKREVAPASDLWRYVTDPREGDWLFLLPAGVHGRALFLGNCVSILPFLLAANFHDVVASDTAVERLQFADHRRQTERSSNLRLLATEQVDAEVEDHGGFDLVALGEDFSDGSPSRLLSDPQRAKYVFGLLNHGGWLTCAGRFTALQERAVDWFASSSLAPATYGRYKHALQRAGFRLRDVYWRLPDRRPYQFYVPLRERWVTAHYLRNVRPATRLRSKLKRATAIAANRLGLLPYAVNSLLLVAQRP